MQKQEKDTATTGDGDIKFQFSNAALHARMTEMHNKSKDYLQKKEGEKTIAPGTVKIGPKKVGSNTKVKSSNANDDATMSDTTIISKLVNKLMITGGGNSKLGSGKHKSPSLTN